MHAGTLCFYVLPRTRWLFLSFKRRYESLIVPVRLIFFRSWALSSSHHARPDHFLPLTGTIILSLCPSGLFSSAHGHYHPLIMPVRIIFSHSRALSSSHHARPDHFLPLTGTIILSLCPSGLFSPAHGHYHPLTVPVLIFFPHSRALSSYSNPSYPLTPCLSRLSPNTYHPSHPAASPNSAAAVQITPSDHPSPALANC
ncbi:hypothetical protein FB550_10762 [Neobacillus bataviensis]|uniref:Uncharacterized protein n=1 Tax=Neobacillus bataviensis TaxID=220685 RepID=A0A561D834_9BACI|nr:hypothetical protein FB550_10762 [Neobacillus bataviensis]